MGHDDGKIVALDGRGRPVPGFVPDAMPRERQGFTVDTLLRGPGETLLAAGNDRVARLRGDGRLDRRFGDDGLVYGSPLRGMSVNAITTDRHGRLVIVDDDAGRTRVARLGPRGRFDSTFGTGGIRQLRMAAPPGITLVRSFVHEVAIDDRDRIVVAGEGFADERNLSAFPVIARLKD